MMNSRERVLTALDHREPDRIPFDLGGTIVTAIHVGAHRALRPALGLPPREPQVIDPIQHPALVEDDLKTRLVVDAAPVLAGAPGTEVAGGPVPATSRARTSEDDDPAGTSTHSSATSSRSASPSSTPCNPEPGRWSPGASSATSAAT